MNNYLTGLLLLALTACASPDAGPPPVELASLAEVTAGLHLAESTAIEVPVLVRDSVREVYFARVLADNGYTREQYDSLTWVVRQEPAWLDSLYERVNAIVAQLEAEQ